MNNEQSLSHTKWECKYHLTWIPKYRKKELYGDLRRYLGEVFRDLAQRRECEILEGHLMSDHAHMLISIPPKYAVSQVVGFIKGKFHPHRKAILRSQKEFYWATLLGQGLPCLYRRQRRGGNPQIYQGTRKRRSKNRSAKFLQINCRHL